MKKAKKAPKLDAKGYPKFGIRDKLAYAAGDFGCNMSFGLKSTVQTFWLIYMMMKTGLLSILLLIVQVWDAINDPLVGIMIDSDKRKYKHGKFKTYIAIGACGLIFGGAAVFLPFPNAPTVVKAILFVLGYMIWDAAYTMANVPYGSMLSLITEDPGERTQLSTWRSIGAMFAGMIPGIVLPMLIWEDVYDESGELLGQTLKGTTVFAAALIMGIIAFITFAFMLKNTTFRVDEYSVKTTEAGEKFNIFKAFINFMKNRPAVGATISAMGMFLGMQSASTATSIVFAIYFKQAKLSGVITMLAYLPMFLLMPFIKNIVNKFGKKESTTVGAIISMVGGLLMFIFPIVPQNMAMIFFLIAACVFGLGMGVSSCVSWAMMADAIDYNEWKTGKREEGTVYSLHSFFRKLAQGIGPSIVLALLGVLGYNSNLDVTEQTFEVAKASCWLVAGLYLFSAICMFVGIGLIYNLDKKTLATMTAELDARHAGEAGEADPITPEINMITIE